MARKSKELTPAQVKAAADRAAFDEMRRHQFPNKPPLTPESKPYERFAAALGSGKSISDASDEADFCPVECRALKDVGFYVYILSDPRSKKPFYVGKGKNDRWRHHLMDCLAGRIRNRPKGHMIQSIVDAGLEPTGHFVAFNLGEEEAYAIENKIISLIGPDILTNYPPAVPQWRKMAITFLESVQAWKSLRDSAPPGAAESYKSVLAHFFEEVKLAMQRAKIA